MRVRSLSLSVLGLTLLAAVPSARAGDPIFDQTRLHEVAIVMDPNDWTSLQRDFLLGVGDCLRYGLGLQRGFTHVP